MESPLNIEVNSSPISTADDASSLASVLKPSTPESDDSEKGPGLHKKRKLHPNGENLPEVDAQVSQVKRRCRPSSNILPTKELISVSASSSASDLERENMEETQKLYESLSSHEFKMQELREKLESGNFEEPFTFVFWKKLHANYGSAAGYALGFLLILLMKHEWMIEEFTDVAEGHSVSKTLVILFLFYGYSFITLGLELIQSLILCSEIWYSENVKEMKETLNRFVPQLDKWRSLKYFYTVLAVLWCMLNAVVGTLFWNWFWWNHTCKSYHDKTCRNSWIGKWIISYRDKACYDKETTTHSEGCEKLVSYCPIMVLAVVVVFLGNLLVPLANDFLSMYYPSSQDLSPVSDIMDQLEVNEEDQKSKESDIGAGTTSDDADLEFNFSGQNDDSLGILDDELSPSNASFSSWKIILLVSAFSLIILELVVVVNFNFLTRQS